MPVKIASFNMFKFQLRGTDKNIQKNLDLIAKIILNGDKRYDGAFDIVAMQEVFSKEAMDSLLSRLNCGNSSNPKWIGRWERPTVRQYARDPSIQEALSDMAAEGFAFIWNKDVVDLIETELDDGEIRVFEPRIYKQYKIDRTKGQTDIVRNPYYARFIPVGNTPKYEIRLIDVHIMFGKGKIHQYLPSNSDNLSDALMRQNEFNVLTQEIYKRIADKRYGNNLPAYTIMLGDYNLNLKRDFLDKKTGNSIKTNPPYIKNQYGIPSDVVDLYFETKDGTRGTYEKGQKIVGKLQTFQDQLTSLKKKVNEADNTTRGYANNYDHMTFDVIRFEGTSVGNKQGPVRRVDTVNMKEYCNQDYEKHRKEVSDHVPIVMTFDLKE